MTRCEYIKENLEQCKQNALPDQEFCVAHIYAATGLTSQELSLMRELREKIGNDDIYKRILFSSPDSVLNWLEEIARRDIDRATDAMQREKEDKDFNKDLTKLHETLSRRLIKILELKKTKKGRKLEYEDIDPATLRILGEE